MRGHRKGARGRGGRGRGRGGHRKLYPSSQGFLYRLESNVEEEDDFRIYGQFDSDQDTPKVFDHQRPQSKKKQDKPKSLHLQPVSFNKSNEGINQETVEIDFATLEAEGSRAIQKAESAQKTKHAQTTRERSSLETEASTPAEESSDFESERYLGDTDNDELLEDMLIMQDYMEHLELESDETLKDLLVDMTDEEELYDYSTLDRFTALTQEIEEEEALMTAENVHEKIIQGSKKKRSKHPGSVDPEVFGNTLKASMAQVPVSLRPGMRAWYEKQERREEEIERKKELKKGKKNKDKPEIDSCLEKADRRMRDFIQDESISCFEFAPMAKNVRKCVHTIARNYRLSSKGVGKKDQRHIVLRKTAETYIPKNRGSIDRYILHMSRHLDEQATLSQKHTASFNHTKPKKPSSKHSKKKDKKPENPNRPSHGAIVAQNAAPIGDSNLGHRMLAAMGWQQGQALGSSNTGIIAPIEAIIRRDKLGLGL